MSVFEFLTHSQQIRAMNETLKRHETALDILTVDMAKREQRRHQTQAARDASPIGKGSVVVPPEPATYSELWARAHQGKKGRKA